MSLNHHRSAPSSAPAEETFHPDPELSEQLERMTARALEQVAVDGAVMLARSQVSVLQREVDQLRAEAQWREAVWAEERAELQEQAHRAQLETAELRARLEQSHLDIMELEDETHCAQEALEEARIELTAQGTRSDTQRAQLESAEAEIRRLHEQLLERERVLGAMWQTLKTYRAHGPIHRFLRPPDLPASPTVLLVKSKLV